MESTTILFISSLCLVSFTSGLTADKACPYKPLDIVFVLDGSGSEGVTNFRQQLQFISNVTQQFEIGQSKTRVALLTFGTKVYNQFYLNQYTNKVDVLNRINSTTYPNGETKTHLALNYVYYTTLNPFYGGERNVTKLVIVLTDGRSVEPYYLKHTAAQLKNTPSVIVTAIGIGHDVDYRELHTIASDQNHTFFVQSFDRLHTLQTELTDTACNACNLLSDVCFVLDSSGSEGADNFNKQLEFIQMVINDLSIENTSQTRVCVITFSTRAQTEINLGQYSDKAALLSNVMKIPYRDGETMTDLGLDNAMVALHAGTANKVAIVLTDGRSTKPGFTANSSNAVHRAGIDVFSVGIGNNVDPNELDVIASDHDHVFRVTSFDHLDEIHESLVSKLCNTVPVGSPHTSITASVSTVPTTMTVSTTIPSTPIPNTSTMTTPISTDGLLSTLENVVTTQPLVSATSELIETTTQPDKLSTTPLFTNAPDYSSTTKIPETTEILSTSILPVSTTIPSTPIPNTSTPTDGSFSSIEPIVSTTQSLVFATTDLKESTTHSGKLSTTPLFTNAPDSSSTTKIPETTVRLSTSTFSPTVSTMTRPTTKPISITTAATMKPSTSVPIVSTDGLISTEGVVTTTLPLISATSHSNKITFTTTSTTALPIVSATSQQITTLTTNSRRFK